jgi:hypothetical protein
MIRAVLFIPPDAHRWLESCAQYAARHGYEVIAIVAAWADADHMAHQHDAVVVTGRRDHVPADRLPRLEVVLEESSLPDPPAPTPTQRRPQRRI